MSDVLRAEVPGADGAAPGYRARATLRIRAELRRQVLRRRTWLAFGLAACLPLVLVGAYTLGGELDGTQNAGAGTVGVGGAGQPSGASGSVGLVGAGAGGSFSDLATSGAANFTVFTLSASAAFLLVVVVALLCGDALASEAAWGSLRYLLVVPVPRGRLLGVKITVGLLTSSVALVVLTLMSLAAGWIAFGWGALRTPRGDDVATAGALLGIAGTVGYLFVSLLAVAALAFWLSTFTATPLAAVGGCVVVMIVSGILDQVGRLGDLRAVLPLHYADAWQGMFIDPVQLVGMAKGTVSALIYAAVFFGLAWWTFLRRDVLS
jgi:ABC-2 type transport system permease protein